MNTKLLKIEKSIEKQGKDIEKSMEFLASKYEAISLKLMDFEEKLKGQQTYISLLETKVEDLSRQAQSSHVEIRNVPIAEKESKSDLRNYVYNISNALKVNSIEVRDVYRWAGIRDGKQTIVAVLNNSAARYDLLKAAKTHNLNHPRSKLNSSHLGMNIETSPIYLSEHLTAKARRLYYLGRQLVKSYEYKFCWTTNGRVYMRKNEGSSIITVKEEQQLEQLKSRD